MYWRKESIREFRNNTYLEEEMSVEKRIEKLEQEHKPKPKKIATWVDYVRWCNGEFNEYDTVEFSDELRALMEQNG